MHVLDVRGTVSKEEVFHFLRCSKNSESYHIMCGEYAALLSVLHQKAEPDAVMWMSVIDRRLLGVKEKTHGGGLDSGNVNVLFLIMTLGNEIQRTIGNYYKKEDYLAHILLNTMADNYLFNLERNLYAGIIQYCKELGYGIRQRIEPDPIHHAALQQTAIAELKAETNMGVRLTDGAMFSPVKTVFYTFILSRDTREYRIDHDCEACSSRSCAWRKE